MTESTLQHAMSVDVEDYFHAHALKDSYPPEHWEFLPQRAATQTFRILELFAETGAKATFFTLGWIAQRHPDLVRAIVDGGHELASHGCYHARVDQSAPADFLTDLKRSKAILEDVGGVEVHGYRAPSFSIGTEQWWAYAALEEAGYSYSSSQHPIVHDHYGVPDAPRTPFRPDAGSVVEIPVATVELAGRRLTCAGGGYFRLMPYAWSRRLWRRLDGIERLPSTFYFHPWEIDAGQPHAVGLPLKARLRHYVNLTRMEAKVRRLLNDFRWSSLLAVYGDVAGAPRWSPQ